MCYLLYPVCTADQLPYEWMKRRCDEEGNRLEERSLQDGSRFEVVKNFPAERELVHELAGIADQVVYGEYAREGYWTVSYTTRDLAGMAPGRQ